MAAILSRAIRYFAYRGVAQLIISYLHGVGKILCYFHFMTLFIFIKPQYHRQRHYHDRVVTIGVISFMPPKPAF